MVSIGKHVLKIDTTLVDKSGILSAKPPLRCSLIDNLTDGVRIVGTHDGEVKDLSVSKSLSLYLVFSSLDGTVCVSLPSLLSIMTFFATASIFLCVTLTSSSS